jgi:hypothetical protein
MRTTSCVTESESPTSEKFASVASNADIVTPESAAGLFVYKLFDDPAFDGFDHPVPENDVPNFSEVVGIKTSADLA